ncbi:hypothetical protein MTR67_017635 [Solanum verrucosum]|uniref:Uncharacterized protein n=1 Tax=Solanum verrucosum TaxID=315347 RepID=A0AAF0TSE0_SOLVR|nr:hypothetical protein MTR67_017635 [Solanum verrucosum]
MKGDHWDVTGIRVKLDYRICAAADNSASLVRIVDQLDDSPFGVVHRRLAPSFSFVCSWSLGGMVLLRGTSQ